MKNIDAAIEYGKLIGKGMSETEALSKFQFKLPVFKEWCDFAGIYIERAFENVIDSGCEVRLKPQPINPIMMERKVIQISTALVPSSANHSEFSETVALCNDGTMWSIQSSDKWVQLPTIPQPEKYHFD